MSFAVELPTDKESAKRLLSKFMENATNKMYLKPYKKAVEIVYGFEFDVKFDLSDRMCFSCEVCHKEMNNVKSLIEHSISGAHLRSKDSIYNKTCEKSLPYKTSKSLQIPLIRRIRESLVKIIGLQYIEAYDDERGRFYYKCNLCGSHGNADILYNHVIGTSHTDKYIKSRVKLTKVVYGPADRAELREMIAKRESFNVDDIAVIKGRSLYPTMWEISGRARPKNKRKEFDFELLKKRKDVEPIPGPGTQREFMTYQYFETILLKFNAIVKVHLNDASDLYSGKDFRFAMAIQIYILHLLFYQFRCFKEKCQSSKSLEFFYEQDMIIKKAMGTLCHKLTEIYNKRFRKEFGDLPVTINKYHKSHGSTSSQAN